MDQLTLAPHARLLVMLSLLDLGENARLLALPFETPECLLEGLVLPNMNHRWHRANSPPLSAGVPNGYGSNRGAIGQSCALPHEKTIRKGIVASRKNLSKRVGEVRLLPSEGSGDEAHNE